MINDDPRANELFDKEYGLTAQRTDRMFAMLLCTQWVFATLFTVFFSPLTWSGSESIVHTHLLAVLVIGGLITSLPISLALLQPGRPSTRYVMAASQMMWSALLIHVTGGRIETHFHVFGSLAFLAFYRDVKVFVPATFVVVLDHLARGMLWPESIYGVTNPEWWRFIEHAGWVVFINAFLIRNCRISRRDLQRICVRQARLEESERRIRRHADSLEDRVTRRTSQLEGSLKSLRQTQAQLEAQHQLTFQFLEHIPLGVVVFEPEASHVYSNQKANTLLQGHDRESEQVYVPGTDDLVPAGDLPAFATLRTGEPTAMDVELDTNLGRRRLSVLSMPITGQNGDVVYSVTTFEDVTDRAGAEAERLQRQKLESVGQLAAGIAHEINTPMQYIGDNTQFVKRAVEKIVETIDFYDELLSRDEPLRAKAEEHARTNRLEFVRRRIPGAIESTIEGIGRVSDLVGAMREFSHPGGNEKTSTNINRAIETTLMVSRNEWKYQAEVELELDKDLPEVPALPGELNQVLLNVFVNAAHAIIDARPDGALGTIRISTASAPDHVEIRVSDNGVGMPPAVKEKIFNPFFTTKEVGRGTGQGLAIARSIVVDKHGGTIEVTSQVGQGATFTIRLPRETRPGRST